MRSAFAKLLGMADHKTPRVDPYQEVTDRIINSLESGTAPWVKPWRSLGSGAVLRNAVSNRPYHGINVFLLMSTDYTDPRWLTFKQAKSLGGSVRKGEKSTRIVFWRMLRVKDEKSTSGKLKTIPLLKLYSVFNVEQCENLDKLKTPEAVVLAEHERDEQLDDFMDKTEVSHREGEGDRAFYRPATDSIEMPKLGTFKDRGAFYATLLHELTHATGHKDRCDRDMSGRFGNEAYAMEELVAEMGAAFLCQRFEVDGLLQHASYIKSWLKVLKEDNKAIFTAASKARKACQWAYGKTGYHDLGEDGSDHDDETTTDNKTTNTGAASAAL